MGWEDVGPSDDVQQAEWIRDRLLPFREARIGSVIPTGFARYVKIDGRPKRADILARHTSTADSCWFCLWDGYGYLTGAVVEFRAYKVKPGQPPPKGPFVRRPRRPKLQQSRVRLPNRQYLLFTGAVAEGDGWQDGPNLWWPADRAWCVASEIDLDYTLVGGSSELCTELIASGASEVSPDDRN